MLLNSILRTFRLKTQVAFSRLADIAARNFFVVHPQDLPIMVPDALQALYASEGVRGKRRCATRQVAGPASVRGT